MNDIPAGAEWPSSDRLVFVGRLRHGPTSHVLSQEIVERAGAILMDGIDTVVLDLVRSAVESLETVETRRAARAIDLARKAVALGHPLANDAVYETSEIVSLADALAADVAAVRQAADDVREAISLAVAEVLSEPTTKAALTKIPQADVEVGTRSAQEVNLTPDEPPLAEGDLRSGLIEKGQAVVEADHPSKEPDQATIDRETLPLRAGTNADVDHFTAAAEEVTAVAHDGEDHPTRSESVPDHAITGTASPTTSDNGSSGKTISDEDEGGGPPVKQKPNPGLPDYFVHAFPRYQSAILLYGPGNSSGRHVVQAVDALLAGRHTPLISNGVDLAERRVFAAVLTAWHALGREINITDNVARVMQRLGAVVKSRMVCKRGVELGDAEAMRIFEATVVPTIGLFHGRFVPLRCDGKQSVEIVVVWAHPQRVAQALWRLPMSNAPRVVLVMTTLNHAQWHDVNAALDGRGASAIFDTGFLWWIGSKASELLRGAWNVAPEAEIGETFPSIPHVGDLDVPPEHEKARTANGEYDAPSAFDFAVSEDAVVEISAKAVNTETDDANDMVCTEILPRRHFWNKPWCWSPIAEQDEKAIMSGPKHAWALLGTKAGGLDLVNDFLSMAKPGIDIHPITDIGSPKEFRNCLQQFASLRSGQHIVLVRPRVSLERAHWGTVSGIVGDARRFGAKSLRIVVLVDPWVDQKSARLAVDGLLGRELGIASLTPLDDEELAEWTRAVSAGGLLTADRLAAMAEALGRWVGALSDAVDFIRAHMTDHSRTLNLIPKDVGLSAEMETVMERLPKIHGSNLLDPPELPPNTVPTWLLRCGAVRQSDDGSLRIDPALWRVLTKNSVVTA